jgi:para-nitrobenzyl esterase
MKAMQCFLVAATAVVATAAPAQIRQTAVTGGAIAGSVADRVSVFKGIPFAASTAGPRRWMPPQSVEPWQGVRQANSYAPACMQDPAMMRGLGDTIEVSEDCLYLNVWTPAAGPGEKLPVMVWIYGGAFAAGATSSALYDGANLARRGVVVVSVAYRVGPMGFLAHPDLSKEQGGASGNYGLMDQIAGLKWVKDNIAAFGGDPDNVTIFGESAGGISVGMLAVSPEARGLYRKAISESGGNFAVPSASPAPGPGTRTLAAAEAVGAAALDKLGAKTLAEARALPAEQVQKAIANEGVGWPIYDGKILPDDPWLLYETGKFNDTPILIGSNSDEGGLFIRQPIAPDAFKANARRSYAGFADRVLAAYPHSTADEARQAQADIMRETAFAWPTYSWARMQARHGNAPAYVYYLDYRTEATPRGSGHASEIQYVFGNLGARDTQPSAKDQALRDQFMGYWTNFAKTGDPNGLGLAEWPRFTNDSPRYMALGDRTGPIEVPHLAKYRLWDDYYASVRSNAGK